MACVGEEAAGAYLLLGLSVVDPLLLQVQGQVRDLLLELLDHGVPVERRPGHSTQAKSLHWINELVK